MFDWIETNPNLYAWVVLPGLIFLGRVVDVTMGTARVVFVSRGYKFLAAIIGFWEVLIWLAAIGFAMQNLSNPMCVIAFALGFATGNYIGIVLTEKLSLGVVLIRVLTQENPEILIQTLKNAQYGITSIDGQGAFGPTRLIFTIVRRQNVDEVIEIIKAHTPNAFYSIEDIDSVSRERLAPQKLPGGLSLMWIFRASRKGK